jgi:hypothetical protein
MKIPEVSENQYVIIAASASTGIILNHDNSPYLAAGSEYYTIVDGFDNAIEFAKKEIQNRENIEIIIYNDKQEMIETIKSSLYSA